MRNLAGRFAVIAATSVLLTACGTETPSSREAASANSDCSPVDVSLLRTVSYDYEVALSPADVLKKYDPEAIVTGRVESFTAARPVTVSGDPEYPDHQMLMKVAVEDVISARSDDLIKDGAVYLSLPQGPVISETREPLYSDSDFARAIPPETRVILILGNPRPELIESAQEALPPGARLAATGLQGMYLDNCGAIVGAVDDIPGASAWREVKTVEDFEAVLRRLSE